MDEEIPTEPSPRAPDIRRRMKQSLIEAIHVAVVASFAVAQPLFDMLGRNATFFVTHRAGPWDVIAVAFAVLLIPPLLFLAVSLPLAVASDRVARFFGSLSVGGALALMVVQPITDAGLGGKGALPLALALMGSFAFGYRKLSGARRMLTIMAPVPLAFAGLFLLATPARTILLPETPVTKVATINGSTPIVLITFDEFSLVSLMDPDGSLDRRSFPNFGRLADRSTWYPGATTVHFATDYAVPAILSGKMPPEGKKLVPVASDYPDSLFSLLAGHYDLNAFEAVTQLCPRGMCKNIGAPPIDRMAFGKDIAIIYGHLLFPKDAADRFLPQLGDRWAGFGGDDEAAGDDGDGHSIAKPTKEDLRQGAGYNDKIDYFQRFVDSIEQVDRPSLWFLHTLMPHKPWQYLADGTAYESGGQRLPGWTKDKWEDDPYLTKQGQQRYLLQAKFTDALMGTVLDKLEKEGLYDDALVIAIADHGVAFRPGSPMRRVVPGNEAELLPIPMLIKYPGQIEAKIDRRNAQNIDVLPTIADVLGTRVPWKVDGYSLLDPDPKLPAKFSFTLDGKQRFPARIPKLGAWAAEIRRPFGGSLDNLYRFGPNVGLLGTKPRRLGTPSSGLTISLERPGRYRAIDLGAGSLPARVTGTMRGPLARTGIPLAVTVNGRVAGLGQTFRSRGLVQVSIMVDPASFGDGPAKVEILTVRGGSLSPIRIANAP